MNSTRMVCSLVLLLSPLFLEAAASSTDKESLWEVVQSKGYLSKGDQRLKPTQNAINELNELRNIQSKRSKYTMVLAVLPELLEETPRIPAHQERIAPVASIAPQLEIETDSANYRSQDCMAEQRATMFAQLRGTGYQLSTPVMMSDRHGEYVSLEEQKPYVYVDKGTVLSNQDYDWNKEEISSESKSTMVWRPMLAAAAKTYPQTLTTVTAMENILAASVAPEMFAELSTATMSPYITTLKAITTDPKNRTTKDLAAIDKQFATLAKTATEQLAQTGFKPQLGYYVRAIVDEFRRDSEENYQTVESSSDFFKLAFGTKEVIKSIRPAIVALYAEVAGAVQDPSASSVLSFLGTNKPAEVSELDACNAALKNAKSADEITALTQKRDELINIIHTKAVAELNKFVQPEKIKNRKIVTDDVRAECQAADTQMFELRNILRTLSELQTMQSILNEQAAQHESHTAASSSSN